MSDPKLPFELSGLLAGTYPEHHAVANEAFPSMNPATGRRLASVHPASGIDSLVAEAEASFRVWRNVPAPKRGELVRRIGLALREKQKELATLISLETGKILTEAEGEVQEMIDIADYAVGLSRQLYGLTMPSERPGHRLMEQWHPLGVVGVITAFNFPAAVWSWNALVAAACGDTVVWKPSEEAPLTAIAVSRVVGDVVRANGYPPLFFMAAGDRSLGVQLATDPRVGLVSATGSVPMGRAVAEVVGRRLGRVLLELGGNNAVIVLDDADLEMAVRAIVFGAVGTAGQRCTSTRRVYAQRGIASALSKRLVDVYATLRIGDPLDPRTLVGPLIHERAVDAMLAAVKRAQSEGGELLTGGTRLDGPGHFVRPAIVRAAQPLAIARQETFAPILYLFEASDLEEAIARQNDVPQGLSSAIFTSNFRNAERFLSAEGSDCGLANVNLGTSGAEIGGAFGGEKDTGGGRESGSDAWKAYMRRQTATMNFGTALPLAQGIRFD